MRSVELFAYSKLSKRAVASLATFTACTVCAVACLAVGGVACGGKGASSPGGGGDPRIMRFGQLPESFKVDKVGGSDGSLEPNGIPDAVFDAAIDGPAIGLVLLAHDASGASVGQWDTLTGADKFPSGAGLYSSHGDSTPGVALWERGQRLNHNDGSISPLSGHHELTLYAEISDLETAKSVELILLTNDGRLVRGPSIPVRAPAPK